MAPRPGIFQAAFTGGVVDRTLTQRTDLDIYARGLADARNLEILPQGGARPAAGTVDIGTARGALLPITPTGNTIATSTGTDRVIGTVTFASSRLAAFDLGVSADRDIAGALIVETSANGLTWTPLFIPVDVTTKTRLRRFAMPPGSGVTCTQLRLRLVGTGGAALALTISGLAIWTDAPGVPIARCKAFTYSRDAVYDLVFTAGNIDVWGYDSAGADQWLAALASPLYPPQIESVNADGSIETFTMTQSYDTALLFHKDVPPHRLLRMGQDRQWDSQAATFTDLPRHNYGLTYANAVTDVWRVEFINVTTTATQMTLTVAGEETEAFSIPSDNNPTNPQLDFANFAPILKAVIEKLPNVKPGITVTRGNGTFYNISFTGAGNDGLWATMTGKVINVPTAAITCAHTTRGRLGGEDIISAARGWPRCGVFWNQRLVMGGLRSLPNAMIVSVEGEFYNFDTERTGSDGGLVLPLDTDADEVIHRLFAGRNLMVFTSSGEYWFSDRALSATAPPTVVQATRNGCAGHVPIVENEGAILYVHNNRAMVLEFAYSEQQQSYDSTNISLLSSSLVKDVRDAALQKADAATDANRYWLVDGGGNLLTFSLLRAQQQPIQAPVPRITDGAFRAVCVNGRNEVMLLVQRMIGGTATLCVERTKVTALLDQSRALVLSPPSATVSGLGRLEGALVWAIADDTPVGPFFVQAGQITLPVAAQKVTVGRWIAPYGETLDLPREIGNRVVAARKRRVHSVRANVIDCTSLAVGANDGRLWDLPMRQNWQGQDTPELLDPFDGERVARGLTGWTPGGRARFSQLRPGRFILRSLISEAD